MEEEDPNELEESIQDGVIIHGFYMDGARWNREEHCVDDQIPVSANYIFKYEKRKPAKFKNLTYLF
jgi:hypothetical protein